MVPLVSASMWFIIFMASTMQRISPFLTVWPTSTNGGFRRGAVEGADHRRTDYGTVQLGCGRSSVSSRGGSGGRSRRRCGRSLCVDRLLHRDLLAVAADANRLLTFVNFQLVDTGLFQQFDQFLDFANIHEALTPR